MTRFARQPDRRGPRLRLKVRRRQPRKALVARASCSDELCARILARGSLRVGGRSHPLRKARRRDVPAGKRTKLRLKLTASARDALAGPGTARVKLRVVARDLLGNRTRTRASAGIAG
ncbi:MAG TPA: hypothetical protein VK919_03120 [Solirubrobacterales bacterium]|nr:hypothetical protein [Solirubrobacterales bacterium]